MMIKRWIESLTNRISLIPIRYIIWDFDGTLYRDEKAVKALKYAYLKFLNKHADCHLKESGFDALTKNSKERWSKVVSRKTKMNELDVIKKVEKNFDKSQYLSKNSGLVRSIENLDYEHLILTNSTRSQVEKCLQVIGFTKKGKEIFPFKKIITREDIKALKPSITAFEMVLKHTKGNKKSHLFIGDSYFEDIDPARKTGFRAIHIDHLENYFPKFFYK